MFWLSENSKSLLGARAGYIFDTLIFRICKNVNYTTDYKTNMLSVATLEIQL